VTIVAWPDTPETQPPLDVLIVDNEAEGLSLNQVDNRIARVDILAGQPIYNFMLTSADRPTSLADVGSDTALLIPSGFVAVSIPATRLGLVGYSLREGDHVDLLASFRFVDMDEGFQTSLANVGILIDRDPEFPLNGFTFDIGRVEGGPIGATLLVTPGEELQRSRQSTQMIIDNVIVLGVGNFPIEDLHQPIVIQAATPPPVEEGEAAEGDAAQQQAAVEEATPVPEVVPPDLLTLVMTRQDALVLKYAIETGSDLTVVLRSALDDEVNVQPTDSVTLDYILNFYGVDRPPALDIAHEPSLQAIDAIHFDFFQSVLTPELEVSRNAIESGAP
jgi:hypothetical protein